MVHADIVGSFLGDFGKWQLRTTLIVFLVKIPAAWFMACLLFTAKTPLPSEIYCAPPSHLNVSTEVQSHWIKSAHVEKFDEVHNESSYDVCHIYEDAERRFYNSSLSARIRKLSTSTCKNFTKVQKPKFHSLIHQFDLLCSREKLLALTQFFHLLGNMAGTVIGSIMVRTISPRHVMLSGMIGQVILGLGNGIVTNYLLHLLLRCSVAATCSLMMIGIMVVTDITHGKYRLIAVCMFEQFWSLGVVLLPCIGTWWTRWDIIYVAITIPTFILIFLYPWMPDPPRWLLKHGRIEEAKQVLLDAAKVNGKTDFDEKELEKSLEDLSAQLKEEPVAKSLSSLWDVPLKTKIMLIVGHIAWSMYLTLDYELLLHVRVMNRNYLEINTALAGVSEIIGTFIGLALILKTSRKWLWSSVLNIVTSLIASSAIFVPTSMSPVHRMILFMSASMIEKMTVQMSLAIFITCMTEIVEKDRRFICNQSGAICARFVASFGPFIGFTAIFGRVFPRQIMAALNVIVAVLVMIFIQTPRSIAKPIKNKKQNKNQLELTSYIRKNSTITKIMTEK